MKTLFIVLLLISSPYSFSQDTDQPLGDSTKETLRSSADELHTDIKDKMDEYASKINEEWLELDIKFKIPLTLKSNGITTGVKYKYLVV